MVFRGPPPPPPAGQIASLLSISLGSVERFLGPSVTGLPGSPSRTRQDGARSRKCMNGIGSHGFPSSSLSSGVGLSGASIFSMVPFSTCIRTSLIPARTGTARRPSMSSRMLMRRMKLQMPDSRLGSAVQVGSRHRMERHAAALMLRACISWKTRGAIRVGPHAFTSPSLDVDP